MFEMLRAWLNGSRDYNTGVAIYASAEPKKDILYILSKGKNEFRERRLLGELLLLCKNIKENVPVKPDGDLKTKEPELKESTNPELYFSCKQSADKKYKEEMNLRAVLFALTNTEAFEDTNTPDRIAARSKLAIAVVQGYQNISHLYDQADYVRVTGRLPDQSEAEENENDHLPDGLVKQTLDNLRKNYNKMLKREQSPERVALQQKHELNIKKLEAKWLLLKPQ